MKHIILISSIVFSIAFAQSVKKEFKEKFDLNKNSKIVIRGEMDVIIENWDKKEVLINAILEYEEKSVISFESSGEHDILIDQDDDEILIKRIRPESHFTIAGFFSDRSKVIIYMPDWVEIDVDIDDADFVAESLTGKVKINGDDGDIIISDLRSRKAKIEFDDGTFSSAFVSGVLILSFNDGEALIRESECNKIICHFDDGEFYINLSSESENTNIEFNDGIVKIGLENEELFYIHADYNDGRVRNRTDLEERRKSEYSVSIGDSDAPNRVKAWFDDGTITVTSDRVD